MVTAEPERTNSPLQQPGETTARALFVLKRKTGVGKKEHNPSLQQKTNTTLKFSFVFFFVVVIYEKDQKVVGFKEVF